MSRTAMLFGATGLVGSEVLRTLLASKIYAQVIAVTRRPVEVTDVKLRNLVIDFQSLQIIENESFEDLFLCMGTTRARTPSQDEYRKIDFDIPVEAARVALANGATQVMIVTAVGANKNSRFLYVRLKGELEDAIAAMPFRACHIFRPSMLVGRRRGARWFESVIGDASFAVAPLFVGSLRRYRPIQGSMIARAMVTAAVAGSQGTFIYEYGEMAALLRP